MHGSTTPTDDAMPRPTQREDAIAIFDCIHQGIAAGLAFQGIVDRVGDRLRALFGTGDLSIRWWDEPANLVHYLYEFGKGRRLDRQAAPPAPDGIFMELVRERQPIVVPTLEAALARGLKLIPGAEWAKSGVFVPILGGGRTLGMILVESYEREDAFDADQVRLLATIGGSMGTALENVRLFNATREALDRQTATAEVLRVISESPTDVQPVFDKIALLARELGGAQGSLVLRYEDGLLQVVAKAAVDDGVVGLSSAAKEGRYAPSRGTIGGRAILERRTVWIEDRLADAEYDNDFAFRAFRRLLSAPLLRRGEPIGTINLAWDEPGAVSETIRSLIESFADQAVIAIENVRLFNETQQALAQQTASADILRVISQSPNDIAPVFEAIVSTGIRLLGCDMAHVMRCDDRRYYMTVHADRSGVAQTPTDHGAPIDPGDNFPSRVIVERAPRSSR